MAGSRYEGAQEALTDAQSRRAELLQIEETMAELAALITEVAELVVSQDEKFISVEEQTEQVEMDMTEG